MFEYPEEIFGAKMREEKFGAGEKQYILHCYDIFGGTYSVRVDGYFISSRFDYGDIHSSSFRSRDGFEGFEITAAKLVKLVIKFLFDKIVEMSELKAIDMIVNDDYKTKVYFKSEADKVIAELKNENERLKKLSSCAFSDDCLRVRQLKRKVDTLLGCLKYLVMRDLIKDCPSKKTATEIVKEYDNGLG